MHFTEGVFLGSSADQFAHPLQRSWNLLHPLKISEHQEYPRLKCECSVPYAVILIGLVHPHHDAAARIGLFSGHRAAARSLMRSKAAFQAAVRKLIIVRVHPQLGTENRPSMRDSRRSYRCCATEGDTLHSTNLTECRLQPLLLMTHDHAEAAGPQRGPC